MTLPEDLRQAAEGWTETSATPRPLIRVGIGFVLGVCLVCLLAFLFLIALPRPAAGEEHSNPWLLTWIEATCCVTNDCCWEIAEREVQPQPNDQWEVLATGQLVPRKGWSPDGRFYRCACDLKEGNWVRHNGANTRCLFVPMRSARR